MISFTALGQHGRLGNQLFQYAFLRTAARRLGVKFYCPEWTGDRIFELGDDGERADAPGTPEAAYRPPLGNLGFVESALDIEDGTEISGYFQSERYFSRESVRRWYTFRPDIVRDVRRRYAHVDLAQCTGIHLRFGDMKGNPQYVVLPPRYYAKALTLVPLRPHILVFSDEVAAAREHLRSIRANFLFVEGNEDFEDLFLMTRCRDFVCSTSTFSWWGAWLNGHADKVVVAPPDGIRPGHPVRCPEFCCPGWIPLESMRPILDDYRFLVWRHRQIRLLTRAVRWGLKRIGFRRISR